MKPVVYSTYNKKFNFELNKGCEIYIDVFPMMSKGNNIDFRIFIAMEPDIISNLSSEVIRRQHEFDYILTFDEKILSNCANSILFEFGTSWLEPDKYQLVEKKFEISMVCGHKTITKNHLLRQKIWHKQNMIKNPIDFFISMYGGIENINNNKTLGWDGICVEPMPERFKSLKQNRNCLCINGCISDSEGVENFIIFPEYTDMLSGLEKTFDENIKNIVDDKIKKNNHKSSVIQVETFVLNDILKKNSIKNIDFVDIDTEGSELIILKTIDFDAFNIDFFLIENNKYDSSIKNFMKTKGYKLIEKLGCDELYKK